MATAMANDTLTGGLLDLNLTMESVKWLVNPWDLDLATWMGILVVKQCGILLWDAILVYIVGQCLFGGKLLGSRDTETYKHNHATNKLYLKDKSFIFINAFVEMVFIYHLFRMGSPGNNVGIIYGMDFAGWQLKVDGGFTLWNTLVASVFLILLDDAIYAPAHRLMHWKPLYPLVHKHHHRQKFPERGYLDAGNEHPVEQIIGLGIFFISLGVVGKVLGIHILSLALTFVYYAFVNVINHTSYDIRLRYLFFGFEFTVGAHEMHHRFFDCNYAKACMWFDILMGTYEPYAKQKRPKAKKKQKAL